MLSKAELDFLEQITAYIDKNEETTNYHAQLLTNKSDSSVKKHFAKFVEFGLLKVEGKTKEENIKSTKNRSAIYRPSFIIRFVIHPAKIVFNS